MSNEIVFGKYILNIELKYSTMDRVGSHYVSSVMQAISSGGFNMTEACNLSKGTQ